MIELHFIPCSLLLGFWSQLPRLCGTMNEQKASQAADRAPATCLRRPPLQASSVCAAHGFPCRGSHSKEKLFYQRIPCSGGFNALLKCGRQSLILPKLSKSCSSGEAPWLAHSPHKRSGQIKPMVGYGAYHTAPAIYVGGLAMVPAMARRTPVVSQISPTSQCRERASHVGWTGSLPAAPFSMGIQYSGRVGNPSPKILGGQSPN